MSTKNLNTKDEFEDYLNELRITYSFECYKENNAEACHLLGDWYAQSKMIKESIQQYKYACEKFKFARSCYKYGVSLLDGEEVECETDIKKAIHFTSVACEQGEPEGCWRNAQILQQQGMYPEALKQHKRYCDMGHYFSHNSCYDTGLILRSPEEITKVPQDFSSAFEYFMKSCSLGNFKSCYEVSAAYSMGRGVTRDRKLAASFKKKGEEIYEMNTRKT